MNTVQSLTVTIGVLTALLLVSSPDPLLTLATGAALVAGLYLLWPTAGLPVLLLPFLMQWLSVATKPIQSATTGIPLNDLAERGADLGPAAWFGLAGLLCLASGMRWTGIQAGGNLSRRMRADTFALSSRFVLRITLVAILAGHVMAIASGYAGPARQPLLMLANVRLAGLFILVYWCMVRRESTGILVTVLSIETIYGMTGFFGEFRTTLIVTMIAVLSARTRVTVGTMALGAAGVVLVLSLVVFWTAIKPEYREFLTRGERTMTVERPVGERLSYLADAAASMDGETYALGLEKFAVRLSYIDFLGNSLSYVPDVRPHTNGTQTWGAIRHVLMPRILFPGKPALPLDTDITARFTGLQFQSFASISLGYLGEFYADFGKPGALLGMFFLGALIGSGYKRIINYAGHPVLINAAIAVMALMPFIYFERALVKLVGGGLTTFIACLLIQRVGIPWVLRIVASRRERQTSQEAPRFREKQI